MKVFSIIIVLVIFVSFPNELFSEPQNSPQKFTTDELTELIQLEKQSLRQTGWGQNIQKVEARRDRIPERIQFNPDEVIQLAMRDDQELAKIIGMGERSLAEAMLWFFPDRFFDLIDIISFAPTLGFWLPAEVHLSRFFGVGLAVDLGATAGVFYNRNFAIFGQASVLFTLGPFHSYYRQAEGFGTGWSQGQYDAGIKEMYYTGIYYPEDDEMTIDGWSDPYAVGVGWALEFHPLELYDFLGGLLTFGFFDFLRDDYANPNRGKFKVGFPVGTFYEINEDDDEEEKDHWEPHHRFRKRSWY